MTSEGAYVMCRTCLNYSSPFSNIFKEILGEGYVYEVLMDVCQLEVSSEDGLPEYVCFDCHQNLYKLHSFKLQTHESNAALHRFKINHEIKIEPVSCFTSSTPNNGSSLKSATRSMKECYVRLSRCDQLLQDGHSPKVNIKKEKEDPSYLGDNESGNIQGADMKVNIKSEKEDPSYLGDNYSGDIQGADVQVPVPLVDEGESLSTSKDANKQKIKEETLQANTQGVVKLNEVLCCENLFSNGNEYEGDDIEIHEHKPYSEDASLTGFSPHLHFMDNTAKGVGNPAIRDGDTPSDGTYLESEHQDIKETSEDGCVTLDSNVKHCEGNPEDIIPKLLERSVHRGVELNLDQSHDEKSLDNVGFKIQEREHLEEIQFECEIFENKFESDYTCRKPRAIYETRKLRNNSKYSLNECSRSQFIDKRGLTREIDKETVKSDNVVSKTYRKKSNVLEDSHVQLRKVKNRDLSDIVVCDHCRKEFKEKSDLLKHLVGFKRECTCKRTQTIQETNKDFVRHDEKHNFKTCNCEFIEKTSVMRECDKFHTKYDNIVTKTFRKRGCKDLVYKDSNVLLREEENGDLLDIMVCDYCREEFQEKSDLLKHLVEHSGRSNFGRLPFLCKYCSKKFHTKENLSRHELTHTGVKPFLCKFCSKQFNLKCNLTDHELIHTGVKPYMCGYCSKRFRQKAHLKTHELTHTGVKPFSCKFCSKKFYQKGNLKNHELIHTGVKPFSCKFCSKKFNHKSNLKNHELIHTGVKLFSCSYCSKKFIQKSILHRHELTHTGVKPFSCKFCSKKFNQKSNLKNHELIHTGVKPFSCSYCSKKFNRKSILNRHELTHTGVKPFSCKFCSKKFNHKSNLIKHELIHTRVEPFSCKYCSKSFYQKCDLNRHLIIHTGVKPFSCKFCSKKFNVKGNLTKHNLIHTRDKP